MGQRPVVAGLACFRRLVRFRSAGLLTADPPAPRSRSLLRRRYPHQQFLSVVLPKTTYYFNIRNGASPDCASNGVCDIS